jgi:hypothetical protein
MELNRDFNEFLACLTDHDIQFLVVGGYAVAAHGHPRYTKDLDVRVRVDPGNAQRIVDALDEFGSAGSGWRSRTSFAMTSSCSWAVSRSGSIC